jgi:hypothetical protein
MTTTTEEVKDLQEEEHGCKWHRRAVGRTGDGVLRGEEPSGATLGES